ncbi:MAG: 4-hydroxy-tetrahydrodipicolinate synthase [Roseburia sp.]|nr:4-hydroxy-tetrahydrodipicolinate synthase [Roseburia sp.]
MAIFKGAGVAIVTPMKNNEEVNYDKLEELINWQIDQGTDCIVIVGTTGESSTLTTEEHTDVIKAAVEFTKHRVPVVAGTGSNCTREAIHLSQEAEAAGADGLLAVTPYYNKATQGGLIRYYTEIAESVKLPIIMYNVPGRTGCNILPETAATLFKNVENIVGIKEATGNVAQAARTMYLTDGKLDLYSGEDGIVVPLMAIGAKGVISVWSNIAPKDVHEMCMNYMNGNVAEAMQMQLKAQPLVDALFSEVNPIPVKKALNLMGMEVGPLRSPLTEMTDANAAKLAEAMKAYGIQLA